MNYSGVQSAIDSFLSTTLRVQLGVVIFVLLLWAWLGSARQVHEDAAPRLPGLSISHVTPFFRQRFDFLVWGFDQVKGNVFRFSLMGNTVISVRGSAARKTFFEEPKFDLTSGFQILSGAIPAIQGVTSDLQVKRIAMIHRRLGQLQSHQRLSEFIPLILDDCRVVMEKWGTTGSFDPFDKVYALLFQTTVRCLTADELADDTRLVGRLKELYDTLDMGTTPATVLLPWLPTPAMIKKLLATREIYNIVTKTIRDRKANGTGRRNDALQLLVDNGDDEMGIVGFIMGLLVAGARSTGTTASWLITYLGGHSEWRSKAREEVQALLEEHAPGFDASESRSSFAALSAQLSTIPLDAWEAHMHVMDSIIYEVLRVAQPHTAMRRNLGPDTYIGDSIVPHGAYLVYPFADLHLDASLYPDPHKFDPSRPKANNQFGYLGWGGGKTTCLGTRLAKVEMKLLMSMLLLGFEFTMVDGAGLPSHPQPNWNDILGAKPPPGSCYFQYERTIGSDEPTEKSG